MKKWKKARAQEACVTVTPVVSPTTEIKVKLCPPWAELPQELSPGYLGYVTVNNKGVTLKFHDVGEIDDAVETLLEARAALKRHHKKRVAC